MNDSSERSDDSSGEEIETNEDVAPLVGEERPDIISNDAGVSRQPWLILSLLLIASAVILLLLSRTDAAFVVAALGISAWFWNMRVRLKRQYGIRKQKRRG